MDATGPPTKRNRAEKEATDKPTQTGTETGQAAGKTPPKAAGEDKDPPEDDASKTGRKPKKNGAQTADIRVGPIYQAWPETAPKNEQKQQETRQDHNDEEEDKRELEQDQKIERKMR